MLRQVNNNKNDNTQSEYHSAKQNIFVLGNSAFYQWDSRIRQAQGIGQIDDPPMGTLDRVSVIFKRVQNIRTCEQKCAI